MLDPVGLLVGVANGALIIPSFHVVARVLDSIDINGFLEWVIGFFLVAFVSGSLFIAALSVATLFENPSAYREAWGSGLVIGWILYVVVTRWKSRMR